MKASRRTLFLAQFSMLLMTQIAVYFTPSGSIPISPMVATLAGAPAVIATIMLGIKAGALIGFFISLSGSSVITFTPPSPVAFAFTPLYSIGEARGSFWSLVICFVPHILIGMIAGMVFQALSRALKGKRSVKIISYVVGGVLGSMTVTILVLDGIYVFFGQAYVATLGMSYEFPLGVLGVIVATNGLLGAVICVIAATVIYYPLHKRSASALTEST